MYNEDFRSFISKTVSEEGVKKAALESAYYTYAGLSHTISTRWPIGSNIYEHDWDVLLILDACRVDEMKEYSQSYDFISNVGHIISRGGASEEWMAKTFIEEYADEVANTCYITGNVFTEEIFDERVFPPRGVSIPSLPAWSTVQKSQFGKIDEIWRNENAWVRETNDEGTEVRYIPPSTVTDRAIRTCREENYDRTIIHYMQPHSPFITQPEGGGFSLPLDAVFSRYKRGELSKSDMWDLHMANLRRVLDSVETLLQNLDAETVVITADHGESFNKVLGMHKVAHPSPHVRKVPWVETTATDHRIYEPDRLGNEETDRETEELLRDLGYMM